MSLLWTQAAGSGWAQARNRGDMAAMKQHRDMVAKAHGVPDYRAGIALRPIYQAMGRGSINDNIQPKDAGFASGPRTDVHGDLQMPWSDDHPLTEHENWHDIPATSVSLKGPVHATQEGVNAKMVAHNLFHPGKLPPVDAPGSESLPHVGDPNVDPDIHNHGERSEWVNANEASRVPRFYRNAQGQTYVADGHHQVAAALLLKKPHIEGRVWDESTMDKQAMSWHNESGEHHPVVHSVRNAGFHGYVDMSADRASDYGDDRDDDDEFDENLYDHSSPDPTDEEAAHQEEHGEYPSSFHERHDEAYQKARQDKAREDQPDHEDDELMDFVGNHGTDKKFWQQHATHGPVDIKSNPVYATQSHVSQTHLDKYRFHPSAPTHTDRGDGRYLGDEAPLMVTHNGRLHTIEGHHRVAAALQRRDHHIDAWHFNADEHGGLPDSEGHMPDHEDYEEYGDYH